jgi:hypothetical protein
VGPLPLDSAVAPHSVRPPQAEIALWVHHLDLLAP